MNRDHTPQRSCSTCGAGIRSANHIGTMHGDYVRCVRCQRAGRIGGRASSPPRMAEDEGADPDDDVAIETCPNCGRTWLAERFPGSICDVGECEDEDGGLP